jgi:hypothetical protein
LGGNCACLGSVSARLRLCGSLSGCGGLPVCFHSAFVDARYIVFNIAKGRCLFGSSSFHGANAGFDRAVLLPDVLLSCTARSQDA